MGDLWDEGHSRPQKPVLFPPEQLLVYLVFFSHVNILFYYFLNKWLHAKHIVLHFAFPFT